MGPVKGCPPSVLAPPIPPVGPWRGNRFAFPLPTLAKARCLPFSEAIQPPATKGAYPLGTPNGFVFKAVNPFRCGRCGGAPLATHPFIKEIAITLEKRCLLFFKENLSGGEEENIGCQEPSMVLHLSMRTGKASR
jgi:hypothetical protein